MQSQRFHRHAARETGDSGVIQVRQLRLSDALERALLCFRQRLRRRGAHHAATGWIGSNGVYAVFALMALDALLPVGGELIMLYAGVLAAGAVSGQQAAVFGIHLSPGFESYFVLALAGAFGYLAGSLLGWGIGAYGGRSFVDRHRRWLHVSPPTMQRAEDWFERFGRRAVFIGRITPVIRSFISIPAGLLGIPIGPYAALTLAGSLLWCFFFAAIGWAVSGSWESFHSSFRYADYAVVAALIVAAVVALAHRGRTRAL